MVKPESPRAPAQPVFPCSLQTIFRITLLHRNSGCRARTVRVQPQGSLVPLRPVFNQSALSAQRLAVRPLQQRVVGVARPDCPQSCWRDRSVVCCQFLFARAGPCSIASCAPKAPLALLAISPRHPRQSATGAPKAVMVPAASPFTSFPPTCNVCSWLGVCMCRVLAGWMVKFLRPRLSASQSSRSCRSSPQVHITLTAHV